MSETPHRGRFAPSPTGPLHLGNARSALLGYLWARSEGGEFLLRIEDLDAERCKQEHVAELREDLSYLGLTFDGPPLFQSQRSARYDEALQRLKGLGRLYPCFCSRAEIARAASAPHGPAEDGPRYPGTCAQIPPEDAEAKAQLRRPAWRFRSAPGRVQFVDAVAGPFSQDVARDVGDFVVCRADGVASYQLAVVVDDHESAITHVLRGGDLLSSTPRQLQLYAALNWTPPQFAHVGLVLDMQGRRLAKRDGVASVAELRQAGVPRGELLSRLCVGFGGAHGQPTDMQTLLASFSLTHVPRGPVVV